MVTERSATPCKYTPPQLAALWGVSRDKVLAWVRSGELKAINAATTMGGRPRYLIDKTAIEAFEAQRSVVPPLPPTPRTRRRRMDDVIEFVV